MNPMFYPNYGYNPMLQPQQQRLAELEQQYPQYSQPQPRPVMNQTFIKCRAVTSIDEAKASMIDLDGSINVFVDTGNKQIYTKQINLDGTATLNTYKLVESTPPIANETTQPVTYVKQEELETVCSNFNKQIEDLQHQLRGYEKAFANLREEKQRQSKNNRG